jgi:hypothetical protein
MIKLGIIVDQTITRSVLQAVSHLPDVDLKGIYFSGGAAVSDQFNVIYNPGELMDSSDTILVLGEKSLSPDMVRQLIRRSKRLFLHALPEASAADINEIIKLEREAGFSCRLFSPFFSCSQFEIFQQKSDSPELVQVRTCFHGAQKNWGTQIQQLMLGLCKKAQNHPKRLDVYSRPEPHALVNFRIEYENGTVNNITVSQDLSESVIEIAGNNGILIKHFEQGLFAYSDENGLLAAIRNFLSEKAPVNSEQLSFDDFGLIRPVFEELKERMRHNDLHV